MTPDTAVPPFDALAAQTALECGQYRRAAALLEHAPPGDAAAWRQLGQAYLRSGRTFEAELPLRRGLALGDPEARLAYGNWLRVIGQFGAAVRELDTSVAELPDGELRCLAQCSQGVALFRLGEVRSGLNGCRSGYGAYPLTQALAHRRARLSRVLGQMHLHLGELETAHRYALESVAALPSDPDPLSRFLALRDLGRVQARLGRRSQAQLSLQAACEVLSAEHYSDADLPRPAALRLGAEAELSALSAKPGASQRDYASRLQALSVEAYALHDSELRLWTVTHLADALSCQGQHAQAMYTLYELGTPRGLPPMLSVLRGILMRRQRQYPQAILDLERAEEVREAHPLLYWRAQLHLADACYQEARLQGDHLEAGLAVRGLVILSRALAHLVTVEDQRVYGADWQELGELSVHALLEPDLAPLMESLLSTLDWAESERTDSEWTDAEPAGPPLAGPPLAGTDQGSVQDAVSLQDAASLTQAPPIQTTALPRLELRLLGPGAATLDGQPCALSPSALLVLCYLHLSPGHSRNDMSAVLFPDFDKVQMTAHFKVTVKELRVVLGPDILLLDDTLRHPRYRVGAVQLGLDLSALRRALADSDLSAAQKLYRGAFLEGLDPESDWADWLRGELQMTLNLELQQALGAARTAPELRRVLKLTERLQKADPDIAGAAPELDEAMQAAQARLETLGK